MIALRGFSEDSLTVLQILDVPDQQIAIRAAEWIAESLHLRGIGRSGAVELMQAIGPLLDAMEHPDHAVIFAMEKFVHFKSRIDRIDDD